MKFKEVIAILEDNGFTCVRQKGSHRLYQGFVEGRRQAVTIACHSESDEVKKGILGAIVRQSGLGKSTFRR